MYKQHTSRAAVVTAATSDVLLTASGSKIINLRTDSELKPQFCSQSILDD